MECACLWYQVIILCGLSLWVTISSSFNVTQKLRSVTQPWVTRRVAYGTPIILKIQKYQHPYLDALFSGLSCVVSVPFYTAFLPLLFWTGHCALARQMTLLMAFCDYVGNCIKDVISAPRPSSPPVRRITATRDEVENAMEYGLPSSHTLNTVCLSGYLLHYILAFTGANGASAQVVGLSLVCLLVFLIGLGRIYLGMHSLIDIISGVVFGLGILAIWLSVSGLIDEFVVSGQNVISFWVILSFVLLFAYPTPERPTPSFEFHTAFNGVSLGIVVGVHQTFQQFHHENVPRVFFSPQFTVFKLGGRLLVGLPTILVVKLCIKSLSKCVLPVVANALGIPVRSRNVASVEAKKQSVGFIKKFLFFTDEKKQSFDLDTGIRLLQYAGLAWSVVDLVPSLFAILGL